VCVCALINNHITNTNLSLCFLHLIQCLFVCLCFARHASCSSSGCGCGCFLWRRVFELTVGSDLPAGAVGGHAGLAGALVGSVLESDHRLAGLQHLLVELTLVRARHLKKQMIIRFSLKLLFSLTFSYRSY